MAGKGVRRWLSKPRIQGEWENLLLFRQLDIPTASVVAYGQEFSRGRFIRGAMVTREIQDSTNLAKLASGNDPRLHDPRWFESIARQLASAVRKLHAIRFTHNDLKWRNILVDRDNQLYLIDCPLGGTWYGPFLQYRIIKDIKTLDHLAKKYLRKSQRLMFYKMYAKKDRLAKKDKHFIRQMLSRKSRRYDGKNHLRPGHKSPKP